MSIKVMSTVWDQSKEKGSKLLLLLAIADHAADDGYCWPGTKTLAKKIRMSVRSVLRAIKVLEAHGELYVIRGNLNNRYVVTVGMERDALCTVLSDRKAPLPPPIDDKMSPDNLTRDKLSPTKCQDVTSEVTQLCHPNHHEPSLNHQEESASADILPENLFKTDDLALDPIPRDEKEPSERALDQTTVLGMSAHCAKARQARCGDVPDWAMLGAEGSDPFYPVVDVFCTMTGKTPSVIKTKTGRLWLKQYAKIAEDEGLSPGEMLEAHRHLPGEGWGAWRIEHHQWSNPYVDSYVEQLKEVCRQTRAGTIGHDKAKEWSQSF